MRKSLAPAAVIAVLVLVWQLSVKSGPGHLVPGPLAVLSGILELAERGLLAKYVVASLFRVTWGYLLAVVLAVPFGLLLGWSGRAGAALGPLLRVLRPISPLAWIPIAILWFGVGDRSAIWLIFLASFLSLSLAAMAAVRNVPPTLLDAGRNFGYSGWRLLRSVVLPAAMPQLLVSLRLTLGVAWLVVVAAEMIAVNSGLGFLIVDARNAGNRYDLVVAGMVLIGAIGLLLDAGMRRLERLPALRWGQVA